jgi:hypothetical protein
MQTRVVNVKHTNEYDYKIMRPSNWGNPFSHKENSLAEVICKSREEAVDNFRKWIIGEAFTDLLQEQRAWIIEHIHLLKGKVLGCCCNVDKGQLCHGQVLAELADADVTLDNIKDYAKSKIKVEQKKQIIKNLF